MSALRLGGVTLMLDADIFEKQDQNASFKLHNFIEEKENVLMNHPWERYCSYGSMIFFQNNYYMYYVASDTGKDKDRYICMLQSKDAINWHHPVLNKKIFNGDTKNNILLNYSDIKDFSDGWDNFYVYVDENPNCPSDAVIKALTSEYRCNERGEMIMNENCLTCYVSADGIHFKRYRPILKGGAFDSLNSLVYNRKYEEYFCYYRGFHAGKENPNTRDVRVIYSKDFIYWSDPIIVDYSDDYDYQVYTNGLIVYPRSYDFIAIPTRYNHNEIWTKNYDDLCGRDKRQNRCKVEPRAGLSLTDCFFAYSRDGVKWKRYNQAIYAPGPEYEGNWLYGDGYPWSGFAYVNDGRKEKDDMLCFWFPKNHDNPGENSYNRYSMRIDGFISLNANFDGAQMRTKKIIFKGSEMKLNFATSAFGRIRIAINDEKGNVIESEDLFGDRVDRPVRFKGDLSSFSGKEVQITFYMKDCDIYSFQFV